MRWFVLRLLAALPTQVMLIGVSTARRCAAVAPASWKWFDLGGTLWLLFWSFVLPRTDGKKAWQLAATMAAVLPILLFPLHALRASDATASSLGHVSAFLAVNCAAVLAARFGRSHLRAGILYFALFVALFAFEYNAFSFVREHFFAQRGSC
jgi:hypothetical protein